MSTTLETTALVIRNASVLDVDAGTYSTADVVSIDGKISSVGPNAEAPSNARVIDGTGKFVIPGLIDAHVHVVASSADFRSLAYTPASYVYAQTARIMGEMLRRGFTTVRDLSGADFGLAMAQEEGLLEGPKIHFCGHALSQTGGHGDMRLPGEDHDPNGRGCCGIGRVADGVDAVRAAARDEIRKGAHHIKIMASGGVSSPLTASTPRSIPWRKCGQQWKRPRLPTATSQPTPTPPGPSTARWKPACVRSNTATS